MNKRLLSVTGFLAACIFVLSQCVNKGPGQQADMRGPKYAGSASCMSCHKSVYESYLSTAHYKTTRPATKASIRGSFAAPDNEYIYSDSTKVMMEEKENGLFQTVYVQGKAQESHPFDITVGSGTKAQTYMYWEAGKYYELPLSYFVPAHSWAISPGFPADHPKFDRSIPSTCFGCHSSMAVLKSAHLDGLSVAEEFEQNKVLYGIDCERCHGPAAQHVQFHTEHPQEKNAMYITKIAPLTRKQKMDMCALCHSGLRTPQKSTFGFKPGDALSDYFYEDEFGPKAPSQIDVHGSQYQLLTASQCYMKSTDMTCSSCHNPHANEKDVVLFSQRCLSCHSVEHNNFCKLKDLPKATLEKNCIDCHMPSLPSNRITMLTHAQLSPTPDSIRTHLITVYADQTKKVIERLRAEQKQ
jgi:hypothetical protein